MGTQAFCTTNETHARKEWPQPPETQQQLAPLEVDKGRGPREGNPEKKLLLVRLSGFVASQAAGLLRDEQ